MPEGDTIARVAQVLGPALLGQRLVDVRFAHEAGAERILGGVVDAIDTHGKHLLVGVRAAEAWTLHVHLGMTGAWHLYPRGARWRRPVRELTGLLATADREAVCFAAPTFTLARAGSPVIADPIARLGPDLLDPAFDPAAIAEVAASQGERPVCDVLLDQRIAAGIGNIYKNELLFYFRLHPGGPAGALPASTWAAIYAKAAALLAANLGPGGRRTSEDPRPGHALWVYGRAGRPCPRCGLPLIEAPWGQPPRVTCWCPRCQPER